MNELKLIPPTDTRVQSAIAPFNDEMLKDEGLKDRKELSEKMFDAMKKYGGIGLSANQVGKPYRMFVMGDHPNISKGKKWVCINPKITNVRQDLIRYKEGCLTFPFLFLDIERPQDISVEYLDENLEKKEEHMTGIVARCFQHEFDHMQGIVFTEHVSKLKLDMAIKKRDKQIKRAQKQWQSLKN